MNNEVNSKATGIGLYQDPASGKFIGAIDENQATAMIQQGWKLHTEGREAAMTSQADLDKLEKGGSPEPVTETEVVAEQKGKK